MKQNDKDKNKTTSNSQLFIGITGPMKFYLDGFTPTEFLRLAALIKSHGGNIARPNFGTITLSKPTHVAGTNHARFHIDWLYDSMRAKKRQDINRYLLPDPANKNIFYEVRTINERRIFFGNRAEKMCELQPQQETSKASTKKSPIDEEKENCGVIANIPKNGEATTAEKPATEKTHVTADDATTTVNHRPEVVQPPALSPQNDSFKSTASSPAAYPRAVPTLFKEIAFNNSQAQDQDQEPSAFKRRKLTEYLPNIYPSVDIGQKLSPINGCWRFPSSENVKMPAPILMQQDFEQLEESVQLTLCDPEFIDANHHNEATILETPRAHSKRESESRNPTPEASD